MLSQKYALHSVYFIYLNVNFLNNIIYFMIFIDLFFFDI